jgi:hypothetical protein
VRKVLSRNARRIRPILQLLTKLDLHGDGVGGNGLSWLDGIYHDGVDTFFVDKAPAWARRWKTLIEESDTQTSARAYEAATGWAVRQGLRNGSLYSKYGIDYADPASQYRLRVAARSLLGHPGLQSRLCEPRRCCLSDGR